MTNKTREATKLADIAMYNGAAVLAVAEILKLKNPSEQQLNIVADAIKAIGFEQAKRLFALSLNDIHYSACSEFTSYCQNGLAGFNIRANAIFAVYQMKGGKKKLRYIM